MKNILILILVVLIAATISICAIQPDMHKNVIVYDSDYTLVTEQEVKTETKSIPVMEKTTEPVKTTKAIESVTVQPEKERDFRKIVTEAETKTKPVVTKKTEQKTVTAPKTTTEKKQNSVKTEKPVSTQIIKTESPKVTTEVVKAPVQQVTVKKPEETKPVKLTQQEETIAWNTWRSNLQNQIMMDTKMPNLPNGTVFQFSFTVDKYGKITNVHTGANPSTYTPYAIQYIAPVIRSYQGRSILNFPEGTARTTTEVTGKWKISQNERYSTPADFNDVEKVLK